jgi:hypothetical protein
MTLVDDQVTITPTVQKTARRAIFWIALVSAALILTLAGVLVAGTAAGVSSLDADNPAPGGAQALVEVLRQQGVEVTVASTLVGAEAAVKDRTDTTMFFYDRDGLLDVEQTASAVGLTDTVVLLEPSFEALSNAAPSVAQAGVTAGTATAKCSVVAATKAGEIGTDGSGYRILDDEEGAQRASGCFPRDDVYSLVRVANTDGSTVSVLGASAALSNEFIAERGNAALALNLLGEKNHLVWYIPTVGDLTDGPAPTLGDLSPLWLTPAIALVVLGGIAATIWRGRRFGPLIIENLPVVVRASETMQGRARLYQSNSSRLHALDALRIGTVSRLATACGLPRAATVEEVVSAVAAVVSSDIHSVRALLIDTVPHTDRELVSLSDDLLELERSVARILTPR